MVKYYLQFPSELIKAVVIELTRRDDFISGSDASFLLNQYNVIKSGIFDNKSDLLNSFISKVDSFNENTDGSLLTTDNLTYIIPIIKDNHSVDCALIKDILLQAKEFINKLDKETWVSSFLEYETSQIIRLYNVLCDTNNYQSDKLPQNANTAYFEVIRSISKKDIAVPTDMVFWGKLYERHTGNSTTLFKDIRDELLKYSRDDVSIEELLFFGDGLFQHGKLDYNLDIADDTLRRMLKPLVTNDERYINLLRRNALSIKRIIEKAKDSINDFKNALESECPPSIFEDPDIKVFSERLIKKSEILTNELHSENSKKEEIKV